MKSEGINFALVGVGGQGTILASDVLAELGLRLGFPRDAILFRNQVQRKQTPQEAA